MSLVNGARMTPDTDPNTKESARDGEKLLQLKVGLFFTWEVEPLMMVVVDGGEGQFFTGREMTMSGNGREVVSLMMVDVKCISVSLQVVLLGGLEVPLVVMIDEGCMEGEMSFISTMSVV